MLHGIAPRLGLVAAIPTAANPQGGHNLLPARVAGASGGVQLLQATHEHRHGFFGSVPPTFLPPTVLMSQSYLGSGVQLSMGIGWESNPRTPAHPSKDGLGCSPY